MNKVAKTLLFLLLLICFGCEQKPPYRIPHYYENEKEMEDREDCGSNIESKYESWEYDVDEMELPIVEDYEPGNLYVPAGISFEQALYQSQPQLYNNSDIGGVGGAKLIAEMSADALGNNTSYDPYNDRNLRILPLNRLKLRIEYSPFHIYNLVKTGVITIHSCVIRRTESIIDDHFNVEITLSNNTDFPSDIEIIQGMMIESESPNVQNVVVTRGSTFSINPNQYYQINVPAFCAAQHRSSPVGTKARITPYVLNAPSSVYNTQQAVWEYLEAPARNKMTFYAWGRGMETGNGHVSPTGHAFVYVPRSGYWGFGSGDGNWIDGQGSLFDHSRQRQYATDSCSVYITDQQLNDVYAKLRFLKDNTPRYHMGIYDCTSFTMDVADAAGVYYGPRWLIQTPIGFMEQLKKNNR